MEDERSIFLQLLFYFRLQCRIYFRHQLLRCTSNERFSVFHPFLIYVRVTPSASFRKMLGNCRCNAMMFELHEVERMILSKIEKSANFYTFIHVSMFLLYNMAHVGLYVVMLMGEMLFAMLRNRTN